MKMSTKPTGQLKRTPLILEAQRFRDELAEVLNLQDWRHRGRWNTEKSIRRQIMSSFLLVAYTGRISLKDIGTLSGYSSKNRHASVKYNEKTLMNAISIEDPRVMPLYKQARTVYRNFEFVAEPEEPKKFTRICTTLDPWQKEWLTELGSTKYDSLTKALNEMITFAKSKGFDNI